jgi:RND family efflux transporter MFP subunit
MNGESRATMRKGAAALIGVALVLAGAAGSYLFMRSSADKAEQVDAAPTPAKAGTPPSGPERSSATDPSNAQLPHVVVRLTPEAVERAGIVVAPVASGRSAGGIRLPGVVEPNAYRQVTVTPLLAGRVTRVSAELGASVRRGQTLAQIYSPELAEAQTKYVSAKAMLEAHDRIHAEHAAQTAAVQSARSQLQLLGVSASAVDALGSGSKVNATTSVPAPIDGVITERAANVGLNVDQATPLFTVVDLSTVWIIADVYEKDFSRVRVGNDATVTTTAYPGFSLRRRISYIDPQVNPDTRTAKVRVEVPNPRRELRLGMYADVVAAGAPGASVPVIPRSAVQNVGDRTVVYLANPKDPGKFTEREVRLGEAFGEQVEVTAGLQPDDVVVTEGSFFVRAERERLGLRPAAATVAPDASTPTPPAGRASDTADIQSAKIVVTEHGFEPANVALRAGKPARLTFLRTTDKTCGTEVVFPSLNIKRALPLNEPVQVDFTPAKAGDIAFACGMNMLRGMMAVQ